MGPEESNCQDSCLILYACNQSVVIALDVEHHAAALENARFCCNLMRYSSQIRAARALLGWNQGKLARAAGVGLATLQRIEQNEGVVKGNFSTILKIQKALEQAGVHFTDDDAGEIGVHIGKR